MTITNKFIIRDKDDPQKFCEFFISEGKDLTITKNFGLEILSVNTISSETNKVENKGSHWDSPMTYNPKGENKFDKVYGPAQLESIRQGIAEENDE